MKTISLSVSDADYEVFRRAAHEQGRPTEQLLLEALRFFRVEKLQRRERLTDLPVLSGPKPIAPLPTRAELYEDLYGSDPSS